MKAWNARNIGAGQQPRWLIHRTGRQKDARVTIPPARGQASTGRRVREPVTPITGSVSTISAITTDHGIFTEA